MAAVSRDTNRAATEHFIPLRWIKNKTTAATTTTTTTTTKRYEKRRRKG